MTFENNLFAALVHTEKGTTCSDNGFQDLSAGQECSDAINYAKSFNCDARYEYSHSWSWIPKACAIYEDGRMYFNSHPSGGNDAKYRSICKKGNN